MDLFWIGILVNGRFVAINGLVEMKNKFGEYTVIIDEVEGGFNVEELTHLVKSILPDARRQVGDKKHNRLYFKVNF